VTDAVTIPAAIPAPAEIATSTLVEHDLACVGCEYNLRTQPLDGVCPECGKPIDHTLRFPHLARSAPRWLTSLVDSVTILIVAYACAVVCFLTDRGRDEPIPILLGSTAWGLGWFAVWLLTRPEPGRRNRMRRARAWALRLVATPPYVAAFAGVTLFRWLDLWAGLVIAGVMLCTVPATFLYYDHLHDAAVRLPSKRLAWQASLVGWLLPPAVLLSMGGIVWFSRWPRSETSVLTMLPMTGLGAVRDIATTWDVLKAGVSLADALPLTVLPAAVMSVWTVAVLVQFRLAFAAAAKAQQPHHPPAN